MTDYHAKFLARVIPKVIPLPKFLFDKQRKKCEQCLHVRLGFETSMRCAKFRGVPPGKGNRTGMHYCLDARTMTNLCGPAGKNFVEAAS